MINVVIVFHGQIKYAVLLKCAIWIFLTTGVWHTFYQNINIFQNGKIIFHLSSQLHIAWQ